MTIEKKTLDIGVPAELLEGLRAGPLSERVPKIAAAMTALAGDHAYLVLIAPNDGGEAVVLGNRPPEIAVEILEDALTAARAVVDAPGDGQVH